MVAWSEEFDTPYASDWGPDWTEVDATDTDYSVDASGAGVLEFTSGSSYVELSKDAPDVLGSSHWRLTAKFSINRIPTGELVDVAFLPGGWSGPAAWVDAYRNPGGPSRFSAAFFTSQSVDLATWQRNVWHFFECDYKPGRSVEWRIWAAGEDRPVAATIEEPLGPFDAMVDSFARTEASGWGDPPANSLIDSWNTDGDAKVEDGFGKLEFPPTITLTPQVLGSSPWSAWAETVTFTLRCQFTPGLAPEGQATVHADLGAGQSSRPMSWYPDGTLRASTRDADGVMGPPTDYATGLDMTQPCYVKVEFADAQARMKAWAVGDAEPGWQLTLAEPAAGAFIGFQIVLGERDIGGTPALGGLWVDELTIDAPGIAVAPALDPIVETAGFASAAGGRADVDWIRIAGRPEFDIGGGACDSPMPFDVYDIGTATFPELTYVGTLCSAYDKVIRKEADGLGAGSFRINRYQADGTWNPEVSASVLGAGIAGTPRLVIPRIPEAAADEGVFGFFLTSGDFKLIDPAEKGGEVLEFGGAGLLSYIGGGVMDAASYITVPFVGEQPYNRTWHLYADSSITTVMLAYAANGTDAVLSSWQLPSINPSGDDLLLLAFPQVRPISAITAAGWTSRVHEDTTGMDGGTGAGDFRYSILDKTVDAGAPPYADTLALGTPTRISAAQVALRRVTGSSPVQAAGDWSAGGGAKTATLPNPVTAGNALIAYATFTSGAAGTPAFDWPDGWTEIIRIPAQNDHIGVAAVAYKEADGSETGVEVTMTDDPASVTSGVVLVAEYPLVPIVMQPAGAILWRIVRELQEPARPSHPIPLLTMDFDYAVDSNGNAWQPTPATAQFQAQVGEPVDSVAGRLLGTGALGVKAKVDSTGIRLSAYNRDGFGTDRTGTDFAAGVVRFERAVNIVSASRKMVTGQLATHSLVQGDGDIYGRAVLVGADDLPHRESFLAAGSQTDVAALNDMGVSDLLQRLRHSESVPIPVAVGDDEAAGRYLPFKHYDAGDRVTVKTGEGDQDFNDATFSVAAITVAEPKGAKTASDLKVILELGSTIQVGTTSSGGGGYGGGGIVTSPGGGTSSSHEPVTLAADANTLLGLAGQELGLDDQAANRVFAGPAAGGNTDPTFRALVDADIPAGIARDAEVAAYAQPLDSDLTAIAALTTTSYGRAFLELANAGAGRTYLGLGTAATSATGDFDPAGAAAAAQAASQPLDSDLTAIAALTTTSYGRSLLEAANAAGARTLLGLGALATGADAGDVPYDPTASGLVATDVQAAIDELDATVDSMGGGHDPVTLDADAAALLDLGGGGQEIGLDTQTANKVFAGPAAGGADEPTFRDLVDADIPAAIARDSEVSGAITTHEVAGDPHPGYTTAAELAAYAQPLDSDLSAIAALTTTAYGRSVLEAANAGALRTLAGLVIGTDVQAFDAELAALAGLASAADKLPYFTGSGTATLADLSAFARTILDDANAAAVRTTLGLGSAALSASTDFDAAGAAAAAQAASQPLDSDLTAFAGLAIAADKLPYGTGSHTLGLADLTAFARTILDDVDAAAVRTTLGLGTAALSASTDFQPIDADLTAIAALATTAFGRSFLVLADAAAGRTLLGLGSFATISSLAHSATTGQTVDDHHLEDHDHDGAPTQKLIQANTHQTPDTDVGTASLHHTIGTSATQAAAGNHKHLGMLATISGDVTIAAGMDAFLAALPVTIPAGASLAIAAGACLTIGIADTTPLGNVVMREDVTRVPSGYRLLDGTKGTTDATDRMIVASGSPGVSTGTISPLAALTTHATHATHAGHSNHVVTQPSAHSNHVFTQPSAHTFTQPSAHTVTQPNAHSFTQPSAHSAHSVTQPSAHSALGTHTHEVVNFGFTAAGTGLFVGGSSTGASLTVTRAVTTTASSGTAPQALTTGTSGGTPSAHSGTAVDAHSAHSGGAVDAHAGTAVSAHAGGAVDAHAGGAVDAHSAHSGTAVDAHSAHDAHDAHDAHALYKTYTLALLRRN